MDTADTSEEHAVVEEVRCALRLSAHAARHCLDVARTVARGLPGTRAALADGLITFAHVAVIAEAADRLPTGGGIRLRLEDHILYRAPDQSPADLRRAATRAVLRLDPDGAQTRHATAVLGWRVQRYTALDGMAELTLHAPAADIAAAWTRLDAIARQFGSSDGRTIDQRRADTCLDLLILGRTTSQPANGSRHDGSGDDGSTDHDSENVGSTDHGSSDHGSSDHGSSDHGSENDGSTDHRSGDDGSTDHDSENVGSTDHCLTDVGLGQPPLPRQQGLAPRIEVLVSLSTLLGLDQQPADLAGYGPITADTARDLASHTDATWRRLVTDPLTGALLDYGRTTYRPPADLRDFVLARDAICVYPHCNIPARLCQIDQIDPYHPETDDPHPAETGDKTGGDTSAANNAPLCVRNHQGKPEGSGNTTATTTAATNGKTPAPATPTEATYPNAGTTPPQSRRSNPTSRRSSQAVGTIGVNHRSGTTEL